MELLGKEPKMLEFGGLEQEKISAEESRRNGAFHKIKEGSLDEKL